MEKDRQLKIVSLNMPDMARQIENALQFGHPVLLQDVLEEMDPLLEPVLAKAFIKRGNQVRRGSGSKMKVVGRVSPSTIKPGKDDPVYAKKWVTLHLPARHGCAKFASRLAQR